MDRLAFRDFSASDLAYFTPWKKEKGKGLYVALQHKSAIKYNVVVRADADRLRQEVGGDPSRCFVGCIRTLVQRTASSTAGSNPYGITEGSRFNELTVELWQPDQVRAGGEGARGGRYASTSSAADELDADPDGDATGA